VPVERIELPTFGLQNRCSTAELNRQTLDFDNLIGARNILALVVPAINVNEQARRQIPDLFGKSYCHERAACAKPPCGCYIQLEGIKFGWGRNHMASRLPVTATFVLSIFFISGLSAANAADPGFCKQYAQAALNQVRGGLANPRCGGGLQGAQWSSDFAVHYEWCLGASFGAAGAERDARTQYLRGCTGR
jgi:hypothetical protein